MTTVLKANRTKARKMTTYANLVTVHLTDVPSPAMSNVSARQIIKVLACLLFIKKTY